MKITDPKIHSAAGPLLAALLSLPTVSGLYAGSIYPAVVQGDGAQAYYRFNDSLVRNNINANSGSLGAAGNATNTTSTGSTDAVRAFSGALAGDGNRSQFYDSIAYGMIPYNAAVNPDNT